MRFMMNIHCIMALQWLLLILLLPVSPVQSFSPTLHSRIHNSRTHLFEKASSTSSAQQSKPSVVIQSKSQPASLGRPICDYFTVEIPLPPKDDSSNNTSSVVLPQQEISTTDLTPILQQLLQESDLMHGSVTVVSRHTTTAITINEYESRLAADLRDWLLALAPPDERSVASQRLQSNSFSSSSVLPNNMRHYKHNDIDQRPDSPEEWDRCEENGWAVRTDPAALQAWRDQEPINAHSHLASMLLGTTECIPVADGNMVLGQWQSVLMVDLDGPRTRTVGVQLSGYAACAKE